MDVERRVMAAIPSKKRLRNPQTRWAHTNPMLGFRRRLVMITGNMMLPIGEPVDAKAIAIAHFSKK
jgi:hypothetical protein